MAAMVLYLGINSFQWLYFCRYICHLIRIRLVRQRTVLHIFLHGNLYTINHAININCTINTMNQQMIVVTIFRLSRISHLIKIRMRFCLDAFTYNIRQDFQHCIMNIIIITLVSSCLGNIFAHNIFIDDNLAFVSCFIR